jgi:hypothetical protein
LSVSWLLDAYKGLPLLAANLVVVPVMISYDRIFETNNLTSEMVKGTGGEMTVGEYVRRIANYR